MKFCESSLALRRQQNRADSRMLKSLLSLKSIDAVFTSPPYPNEKDYTRTTRLESVLLGFIRDKHELQKTEADDGPAPTTRGVYKGDDDHQWISEFKEIARIADEIEARRIAMRKTSGFERLYATVTKLYSGGMALVIWLTFVRLLRKGAMLGYVVGDQASYLRVMIRTGTDPCVDRKRAGYERISIDAFLNPIGDGDKRTTPAKKSLSCGGSDKVRKWGYRKLNTRK